MRREQSRPGRSWGAWAAVLVGFLMFLLGAGRFVARHHFGFIDAVYCCVAVLPAGLLLLVFDYVLHHAKLVSILVLAMAAGLAISSPVFNVALGLALLGATAGPLLREWREEQGLHRAHQEAPIEPQAGVGPKE